MSALAKPLVTTTNTDNAAQPVNLEHVATVETTDVVTGGVVVSTPEFQIQFTMARTDVFPKVIIWRYTLEATRDTDFTNLTTFGINVLP